MSVDITLLPLAQRSQKTKTPCWRPCLAEDMSWIPTVEGRYFIDRDGTYFIHILNFLRDRNQLPAADIALEVRIACGDSDLHIVRSRLWSRASRNRYTIPDRALKYLFRFRSPKNRVCDWLQVKN